MKREKGRTLRALSFELHAGRSGKALTRLVREKHGGGLGSRKRKTTLEFENAYSAM